MAGFLLPNEMPYCKHDRHIKGGQKTIAFLCRFFRPTSDVNISKTVYPIYLKIKVHRVPTSHSSHINFQVNRITLFRDIDVGSWPKKTTKKLKKFDHPFIYRVNIHLVHLWKHCFPCSKVTVNLPGHTKIIKIDTNLGNLFLLRVTSKNPT